MSLLNSRYLTAVQRYDDEGIHPSVVRSRCVGRIVTSLICCRKCASCSLVCSCCSGSCSLWPYPTRKSSGSVTGWSLPA